MKSATLFYRLEDDCAVHIAAMTIYHEAGFMKGAFTLSHYEKGASSVQ